MSKQPVVKRTRNLSKTPKKLSTGEETFMLYCRAEGLNPAREVAFHPKRKWRIDFTLKDDNQNFIAIEIEGMGRHQTFVGYARDCEKHNAIVVAGYRLLRFTTAQVKSGEAIATVLEALGRKPRGIDDAH